MIAAGVIDIITVFELVNDRAKAMENGVADNSGKMVAIVNLDIKIIDAIFQGFRYDNGAMANCNSYNQIVVLVAKEVFDKFMSSVKSATGRAIPLKVSRPYHRVMMEPAADKFKANLDNVIFKEPVLPIYMNVTGESLSTNDSLSVKLYERIIKPVWWIKTIQSMRDNNIDVFMKLALNHIGCVHKKVKMIDIQIANTVIYDSEIKLLL